MRRVVLLLVDSLRPDLAEEMLAAGQLPALEAMTAPGGRTRAVTAFPSTTSVAYLPFLTGCTPGHCDIPSIRWLDRAAYRGHWWRDREQVRSYCGYQAGRLDGDLAPHVRTIFQLVPESVGLFTPVARGLTPARDPAARERPLWGAVGHYALWHQPSDDVVARHLLREIEWPWRFIFAQFPAVDGYTHQTAPDSPKVREALRRVDGVVAELRRRLARRGELDDTLILLVSDHGATPVHTHLDLADWFRAQGARTLAHPILWERHPTAAVMVAGNGSAMVYARPGEPRAERWPLARLRSPEAFGTGRDIVTALLAEDAVALVAAESGDGAVAVLSREGEAELRWRDGKIAWTPRTADVLGLGPVREATARHWLEQGWDGPWPDAPYQLLDQFRSRRTGDLVVIAREGYDFRRRFEIPEHKAGHGSLFRAHMQVPLWSSHPGPASVLRTADLFPGMLGWLGEAVPEGIDGEAVWRPWEQADARGAAVA